MRQIGLHLDQVQSRTFGLSSITRVCHEYSIHSKRIFIMYSGNLVLIRKKNVKKNMVVENCQLSIKKNKQASFCRFMKSECTTL